MHCVFLNKDLVFIDSMQVLNSNLDGHISNEDYLMCNKIWKEFNRKNTGDYYMIII